MTTEAQGKKNYKQTLNLPQTSFAMEAKLVQNEPKRLAQWQEMVVDPEQKISRPRQIYTGPVLRKVEKKSARNSTAIAR